MISHSKMHIVCSKQLWESKFPVFNTIMLIFFFVFVANREKKIVKTYEAGLFYSDFKLDAAKMSTLSNIL